jgi:hypothetical protein
MKKFLNEFEQKEIIDLYKKGVSNKKISEKFNLHRTTIQRLLKKHGIGLHKRKSELICDKYFFDSYTKESCYWAGFILADGYIRKNSSNLHIKLQKKDKEHLFNFLKCLKISDTDITKIIKNRKDYVSIDLFIEDLVYGLKEKFSIGSKKSLTAFIDNNIPNHFMSHFIRGYFDGDGSISNAGIYPSIQFTGTINTLNSIMDFFIKAKIKKNHRAKIYIRYHNIIGSIAYQGFPFLKKFFEVIYNESSTLIELKRKHEKIIYFLNIRK